MTNEQELELWRLANERKIALLATLLQHRRHGAMTEDEWTFAAIKALSDALATATAWAVDAEGRAGPRPLIVPRDANLGPVKRG